MVDGGRFWKSGHRSVDAGFSDEMQHGKRRAIGRVGHVVRASAGKPILRVKTGDLQDAAQAELFHPRIGLVEKGVVLREMCERVRVDEQGGLHLVGRGTHQQLQLIAEAAQQVLGRRGLAMDIADTAFHLRRLGKGAQIQPDHHAVNPGAGLRHDGIVERLRAVHAVRQAACRHCASSCAIHSALSPLAAKLASRLLRSSA